MNGNTPESTPRGETNIALEDDALEAVIGGFEFFAVIGRCRRCLSPMDNGRCKHCGYVDEKQIKNGQRR